MSTTKHRCKGCGRWLVEVDDDTLEIVKRRRAVRAMSTPEQNGIVTLDSLYDFDGLEARGVRLPKPPAPVTQIDLVCDCTRRWVVRRDTPRIL